MDRGAWEATVHGVTKESDMAEHACACVTEPICSTPETNTILVINYTPIQNKKKF